MKLTKMQKYVIYMAIGVIVIALVYTFIQKIGRIGAAQVALKKSQQEGFNPRPYTDAIYIDLNKGFGEYSTPEAYTNVANLSNDDYIRAVWYDWEVNYKEKAGTYKGYSLAAAIDYANFYYKSSIDASNKLITKLRTLNLS